MARKKRKKNSSAGDALIKLLGERAGEELIAELTEKTGCDCFREETTNEEAVAMALIKQAIDGNVTAAKYVIEAAEKRRAEEAANGDSEARTVKIEITVADSADDI